MLHLLDGEPLQVPTGEKGEQLWYVMCVRHVLTTSAPYVYVVVSSDEVSGLCRTMYM